MNTGIYAIASVLSISLVSLTAVTALYLSRQTLDRLMFFVVALATGAMLGNGLVHILPEAFEHVTDGEISSLSVSLLVTGGFLLSFLLNKVLNLSCHHSGAHFHDLGARDEHDHDDHGHDHQESKHIHPTGHMSMLSHGLDNFTDGILIGIAYLTSIPAGIGMTTAIILHEIPMEFGGFGILVAAGVSRGKAVLINFLSGMVALLGTSLVLLCGSWIHKLPIYLTPVGAGIVIYLVASGLIPQLQKENNRKRSLIQTCMMLVGVMVMVLCKMVEG
ncbi:MAG: ZIP family metal transporter [Candidatus Obscuribacterales bacterium]